MSSSMQPEADWEAVTYSEVPKAQAMRDIEDYIVNENTAPPIWSAMPEIPLESEVSCLVKGEVQESLLDVLERLDYNIPRGPFRSKEDYLKTMYRLMRDDAVRPLRKSVIEFRNKPDMDESDSNHNCSIYDNVSILT